MKTIISKAEAKAQGLKYFYTGKFCRNNHLDKRSTKTGACAACHAAASRRQRVSTETRAMRHDALAVELANQAAPPDAPKKQPPKNYIPWSPRGGPAYGSDVYQLEGSIRSRKW